MRIVFDTNVIIDAIAAREPFCMAAQKLLLLVSEEKLEGYLTANSVTDVYYVTRRSHTEAEAKEIIRSLLHSLEIIAVDGADCWQALGLPMSDFEDALIAACAEKIEADYIVSRDVAFAEANTTVKVIEPVALLEKIV